MADKGESLVVGRETRRNAGNLMSKLIEDEQEVDDFYKTAFGGFEEESGDEKYSTEEEEADVVDSDFSVSETDEVIEDQADDEPVKKRKKLVIKPYKAPKKDTGPSTATKEPEAKKRKSFEDAPREGVRKSTRALTVERAEATKNRFKLEKEKKNLLKKKQPKKFLDMRRLTQEELLAEAKITEEENVASLQAYQQLEADKKKTKIQKVALKGPIIRFHSLSMPVVEVSEPLVKVDDNEDEEVNVDSTKRCCRNFLIFTDAKNFPSAYFPTKKLKVPHKTYCPVTGSPARYQDPVTGLPFANAQAFRYIRERYAMQVEEMKGKTSELEQRRARKL
ncbi:vacuolar protein sorting-associated protein 72 homolog [Stylophora pistillata]|uniref:vacuolar protein sorting-associated protein 72 homolog n=1 Tax=Stylophora pistillata TaxID=50429 RepID=UPI000C03EAD2|nr:vacuolar protein sorting-associated protein 72 homolog [Stylophora pistillata]